MNTNGRDVVVNEDDDELDRLLRAAARSAGEHAQSLSPQAVRSEGRRRRVPARTVIRGLVATLVVAVLVALFLFPRHPGVAKRPTPAGAEPSCWTGPVQLVVTDAASSHGALPVVGLYQFVVLQPTSAEGQPITDLRAGTRAAIFEPEGEGWRFVSYLPVPAPNSNSSKTLAVIQFTGAYTPATRYLVEVSFRIVNGNDPTFKNVEGSTVSLCTTLETEGTRPGVTTVAG